MEQTAKKERFLMSPKVDFCFKELMRNSEVRKGFLAAVLDIPPEEIEETILLPTHLFKEYEGDKLGILDFVLFRNEKDYYSRFHLWEDHRDLLYSDKLEIHICELPKLRRFPQPETELLNWMRFINAEKEEEMEKMAERNGYIQTAYDELKMLSADEKMRLVYEERLKAERDYISFANDNWRRGMEAGIEKGIEKGLEDGRKQGLEKGKLLQTVRASLRMFQKGFAPEEAADLMGEDPKLIQKIQRCRREFPEWTEEEIVEKIVNP